MRQIGRLPNQADANRFAAFLITQGITAHAEPENGDWALWVRDEDQTQQAKEELVTFVERPNDARYDGAERAAQALLVDERRKREAAKKNIQTPSERWKSGVVRRIPLTRALVTISVVATILGSTRLLGTDSSLARTIDDELHFVKVADYAESNDPLVNVKQGEVWRLVTPIFVHADPLKDLGILHILFNMYWLVHFGGMIEQRRGPIRLAMIVLIVAIVSNVAQATFPSSWGGAVLFGGMSGVLYGTFGYVWMKSWYDPSSGMWIDPTTIFLLVAWLFVCMTPAIAHVANVAHVAGLISGFALGLLPPLKRSGSKAT